VAEIRRLLATGHPRLTNLRRTRHALRLVPLATSAIRQLPAAATATAAPEVKNSKYLTAHQPGTPTNMPLTSGDSELQLEY
jgi:hypothetical protein